MYCYVGTLLFISYFHLQANNILITLIFDKKKKTKFVQLKPSLFFSQNGCTIDGTDLNSNFLINDFEYFNLEIEKTYSHWTPARII